jgi:multidrug efflux pump subunit AcrB
VYIFTFVIVLAGTMVYRSLPKEQFPDIIIPNIYVSTIYPGTSPEDMETLITKPIEKELKSVSGVKKVTSTSIQDFSAVLVEFNAGENVAIAKQRVTDAVDRAKNELPDDLDKDPQIAEVEFSEFPIMNLNLSGDYSLKNLKVYAEDLEDAIEELPEIKRVDIVGALNREIQINLDLFKAEAAGITFRDIEQAVAGENVNISGGEINLDEVRRTLRVTGEIKNIETLKNIVVRGGRGQSVFLKDIADVRDGFEEKLDFASLDGKPVISLNIIKRGGKNLIDAADGIDAITERLQKTKFPAGLKIVRTADQSERTRADLNDLINTVVLGFIFVVIVLMFFMGTTDAVFVGLSVPLSALVAFIPLLFMGFTLNIVVMFAFLLGLGIVVDDAIVVIENTHRLFNQEGLPIKVAAKKAAGEVFFPVFSGTLVNVAPFTPLVVWPGIVGEFMRYLPITLIFMLFGSLFVAFVINPVFAVSFMKRHSDLDEAKENRRFWRIAAVLLTLTIFGFVSHLIAPVAYSEEAARTIGTSFGAMLFIYLLNRFVLGPLIRGFQRTFIPALEHGYRSLIMFVIHKWRPLWFVLGTFAALVGTIMIYGGSNPKVGFFPQGDPNYVYVYVQMPIGTDGVVTDSIMGTVYKKVNTILKPHKGIVLSVISNVGIGAGDPDNPDRVVAPHKGKLTVAFVPLAERIGISTQVILNQIRDEISGIPGAIVSVEKESNGPPTGKPISIEISGDDLIELLKIQNNIKAEIARQGIKGIDQLKSDLELNKPEIILDIDREKASREGISTVQVALAMRTALFGKEISQFREAKDEYPIMLRLDRSYRDRLDALLNQKIDFRDQATGEFKKIPISSVATLRYSSTYSAIKRKNQQRVVTVGSDVVQGYNANEINV